MSLSKSEKLRPSRNKIGSINYCFFLHGKTLKYYDKIGFCASSEGCRYSVITSPLFSYIATADVPVLRNACHLIHMLRTPAYEKYLVFVEFSAQVYAL